MTGTRETLLDGSIIESLKNHIYPSHFKHHSRGLSYFILKQLEMLNPHRIWSSSIYCTLTEELGVIFHYIFHHNTNSAIKCSEKNLTLVVLTVV